MQRYQQNNTHSQSKLQRYQQNNTQKHSKLPIDKYSPCNLKLKLKWRKTHYNKSLQSITPRMFNLLTIKPESLNIYSVPAWHWITISEEEEHNKNHRPSDFRALTSDPVVDRQTSRYTLYRYLNSYSCWKRSVKCFLPQCTRPTLIFSHPVLL